MGVLNPNHTQIPPDTNIHIKKSPNSVNLLKKSLNSDTQGEKSPNLMEKTPNFETQDPNTTKNLFLENNTETDSKIATEKSLKISAVNGTQKSIEIDSKSCIENGTEKDSKICTENGTKNGSEHNTEKGSKTCTENDSENGDLEEGKEEGECGFCLYMKGGGCKERFIAWEDCIEEAEEKSEDVVDKCFEVTTALKKCMEVHSEYYSPILQAEKAAQAEAVKALEKEKEREFDE